MWYKLRDWASEEFVRRVQASLCNKPCGEEAKRPHPGGGNPLAFLTCGGAREVFASSREALGCRSGC